MTLTVTRSDEHTIALPTRLIEALGLQEGDKIAWRLSQAIGDRHGEDNYLGNFGLSGASSFNPYLCIWKGEG
jgi:hypothetical protein